MNVNNSFCLSQFDKSNKETKKKIIEKQTNAWVPTMLFIH